MDWIGYIIDRVIRPKSVKTDIQNHAVKEEEQTGESGAPESVTYPCTIGTCRGECYGMGWCKTATDFRNAITPTINNVPHKVGCDCIICMRELNL